MFSIVTQVGEIFAGLFSRDECLDIVLLNQDSERDAEAACKLFYLVMRTAVISLIGSGKSLFIPQKFPVPMSREFGSMAP